MHKSSNNNIFLIEDHHQALDIWRKEGLRHLDLVHIDAHIDFAFSEIKEPKEIFQEAKSIDELKSQLEREILFNRYGFSKERLVNIGNYIYSAMREGIIKDFYWVVPGDLKEFRKSSKRLSGLVKRLTKQDPFRLLQRTHRTKRTKRTKPKFEQGRIRTQIFGRNFIICILEKLPVLKRRILLDIDTDFLILPIWPDSNKLSNIEKRIPWILPDKLVEILKKKIKNPLITTIAYSVNGGFTPIRYKHFAETIAYGFSPRNFERNFKKASQTARYFSLFQTTEKAEYYQRAVKLNPTYRVYDNNLGPVYLEKNRLSKAQKEFVKIKKVDPKNPHPYVGLGNIALRRKDFSRAKRYFISSLRQKANLTAALLGLAKSEFKLKNFKKAKDLFIKYQKKEPMQPNSHYFLAQIYEKRRDFNKAIGEYQHAIRLGLNDINAIERLLKISKYGQKDLTEFINAGFNEFKKRLNLGNKIESKRWRKIEKRMRGLEGRLERIK